MEGTNKMQPLLWPSSCTCYLFITHATEADWEGCGVGSSTLYQSQLGDIRVILVGQHCSISKPVSELSEPTQA